MKRSETPHVVSYNKGGIIGAGNAQISSRFMVAVSILNINLLRPVGTEAFAGN